MIVRNDAREATIDFIGKRLPLVIGPQSGLDMRDGFYSGSGYQTLVTKTQMDNGRGMRGGHGFSPSREALQSSFVARGPSVRSRGSLGVIRMTQIAPTLARWLGVGLSPLADGPIDALIQPATPSTQAQRR